MELGTELGIVSWEKFRSQAKNQLLDFKYDGTPISLRGGSQEAAWQKVLPDYQDRLLYENNCKRT